MSNILFMSEVLTSAASQGSAPLTTTIEMDEEGDQRQSLSGSAGELTPVTNCCLKKKCYESVLPRTQNDLFNNFWRIGDYAKQNYFLVGLMAAQSPKQVTSRPLKKNKSLSWKYWVDIRGRKVQVCKGFFLAVYGVSDKRLRVLQTKLVNGEPLEDQRGKYDNSRRANQHTARRKHEDHHQLDAIQSPQSAAKSARRSKSDTNNMNSSLINDNTLIVNEIVTSFPQNFTTI